MGLSCINLKIFNDELFPQIMATPPLYEISLAKAWDTVSEGALLAQELRKLGLYGPQFAYSAFVPTQLDLVLSTGTYHRQNGPRHNFIDCCLIDEGRERPGVWDHDTGIWDHDTSIVSYAEDRCPEGTGFMG